MYKYLQNIYFPMSIHEGQYLRKLLKDKGIGVNMISEKFDVSRTAVYQYFDSTNLSDNIKDRFQEHFNLSMDDLRHVSIEKNVLRQLDSSNIKSDIARLTVEIEHQKQLNEEMQKRIKAQEATIQAQQKLISFLSIKRDLDIKLGKDRPE